MKHILRLIKRNVTRGRYLVIKCILGIINRFRYNAYADPEKLIFIDVSSVSHKLEDKRYYPKWRVPGWVGDGEWDRKTKTREEFLCSPKFMGMEEHFIHGVSWKNTVLFRQLYSNKIAKDGTKKGASNLDELEKLYKKYDVLFQEIKNNGIRPATKKNKLDPLYVLIGRNGEIIYTINGNHRLYIAIILGLDKIPVKVLMRHEKWQQIREEIASALPMNSFSKYPHLKDHPDLQDLRQKIC